MQTKNTIAYSVAVLAKLFGFCFPIAQVAIFGVNAQSDELVLLFSLSSIISVVTNTVLSDSVTRQLVQNKIYRNAEHEKNYIYTLLVFALAFCAFLASLNGILISTVAKSGRLDFIVSKGGPLTIYLYSIVPCIGIFATLGRIIAISEGRVTRANIFLAFQGGSAIMLMGLFKKKIGLLSPIVSLGITNSLLVAIFIIELTIFDKIKGCKWTNLRMVVGKDQLTLAIAHALIMCVNAGLEWILIGLGPGKAAIIAVYLKLFQAPQGFLLNPLFETIFFKLITLSLTDRKKFSQISNFVLENVISISVPMAMLAWFLTPNLVYMISVVSNKRYDPIVFDSNIFIPLALGIPCSSAIGFLSRVAYANGLLRISCLVGGIMQILILAGAYLFSEKIGVIGIIWLKFTIEGLLLLAVLIKILNRRQIIHRLSYWRKTIMNNAFSSLPITIISFACVQMLEKHNFNFSFRVLKVIAFSIAPIFLVLKLVTAVKTMRKISIT